MFSTTLVAAQPFLLRGALGPTIAIVALVAVSSRVVLSAISPEGAHGDLERRALLVSAPLFVLLAVVIVARFIGLSF
jgi:hypothetical protein